MTTTDIAIKHGKRRYDWAGMQPGSVLFVPILKDGDERVPTDKERYKAQASVMSAALNQVNRNPERKYWGFHTELRWRHIKLVRVK